MDMIFKKTYKNKFGQYFTPKIIADFMISLADITKDSRILEPCCGEGVFLKSLLEKGFHNLKAFEIDDTLSQEFDCVEYKSFVSADIDNKFDLIIGNPPYIRWKNLEDNLKQELNNNILWNKNCNSLCDYLYIFILKSVALLKDGGQLIFICPEYWINTTHSMRLRNYIIENGYFEKIFHFNEAPIFEKVTSSLVIFKFIKSQNKKNTINMVKYFDKKRITSQILSDLQSCVPSPNIAYLTINQFVKNERWLCIDQFAKNKMSIFEKKCKKTHDKKDYYTIGDFFDIGNGMVTGLDKAFQIKDKLEILNENEKSSIVKVLKAKDLSPYYYHNITPYIFLPKNLTETDFIDNYNNFFEHLAPYKINLENRYNYNKNIPFWEWVFLRNFNLFSRSEKRIFVPSKERISNKKYFRFALVDQDIYPTQDVTGLLKKAHTKETLEYITAYLNSDKVFDWLVVNGIIKGGIVEFSEKPLASIPYRAIDWNNPSEVKLHNDITLQTQQYIKTQDIKILAAIKRNFNILFQD